MPPAGDIAKLFGFIAKETSTASHLTNAAMGVAAKGVYNIGTGRDLTDGMLGWGVMGAAAGVGFKTYKNMGLAPKVAKDLKGFSGAIETLGTKVSAAKAATGEARAAAVGELNSTAAKARGFNSSLNESRQTLGLRMRGGVRANQAAQTGGPVAAAVASAPSGATLTANQPIVPVTGGTGIQQPFSRYDTGFGSKIMGSRGSQGRASHYSRAAAREANVLRSASANRFQQPFARYDTGLGVGIMQGRGLKSRASQYSRAASREASTLKSQAGASRSAWTNMTQKTAGAWVG